MHHILNTEQHTRTSLIAAPFGDDGAVHLTPVDGDQPGRSFILDATAARELASFIDGLNEAV